MRSSGEVLYHEVQILAYKLTDISNAKKKLLHDCSITAEKLFFMPKDELFDILFFTDDDRKIILESRASYDVEKEWILFQQKDIGFVTMEDEAYPDKLRNIHNPPYSLFYIGALPDKSRKSVAIVGARGRSAYGCEVAKVLAAALSRQGIQIISGMARGIDRDAIWGVLRLVEIHMQFLAPEQTPVIRKRTAFYMIK